MAQLLPHFFMPGRIRLGLEVFSGILDLISLSFRFDGLLYAVKGGRGNISARSPTWPRYFPWFSSVS